MILARLTVLPVRLLPGLPCASRCGALPCALRGALPCAWRSGRFTPGALGLPAALSHTAPLRAGFGRPRPGIVRARLAGCGPWGGWSSSGLGLGPILATVAFAAFVLIARLLGLLAQRFPFFVGLDIGMQKFLARALFQFDQHGLLERINIQHLAWASGGHDALVALGHALARFHILLVFIYQAAAQSPAHARDLAGRERNALLFGHLDRHRAELGQEHRATAVCQATGAHAAQVFGDIARPNLTHLDDGTRVQTLHRRSQAAQINLVFLVGAV